MAAAFDPYRKWLGISPKDQPPNHYRLLGIELFEDDPDVIANAADRQMTHVRTFQAGRHSQASQKILNELAAARLCLLDAERKTSYDEQLRSEQETATREKEPPPILATPAPTETAAFDVNAVKVRSNGPRRPVGGAWMLALAVTGACVLAVSGVLYRTMSQRVVAPRPTSPPAPIVDDGSAPPAENGQSPVGIPSPDPSALAANDPHSDADGPSASPDSPPSAGWIFGPRENGDATDPTTDATPSSESTPSSEGVELAIARQTPPPETVVRPFADQFRARYDTFMASVTGDRRLGSYYAARHFLNEHSQHASPSAAHYAWAMAVAEASAAAGDSNTVNRMFDELRRRFDENLLPKHYAMLAAVQASDSTKCLVAADTAAVADQALSQLDFDMAGRFLELAEKFIDRALDPQLADDIGRRKDELAVLRRRYEQEGHQAAVEDDAPSTRDAEANTATGAFLCFQLGAWQVGLPFLANGSNPSWRRLALFEVEAPADATSLADALLAAADGWWDLAEKTEDSTWAWRQRRHATELYRALPPSSGDAAARVASRRRLSHVGIASSSLSLSAGSLPAGVFPRLACRQPVHRALLTRVRGGTTTSELMVTAGIDFLIRHQVADQAAPTFGGFVFPENTVPRRPNQPANLNGYTGLSLLPILTAQPGTAAAAYGGNLNAGMAALGKNAKRVNATTISFFDDGGRSHVASHAWSTIACCEAAALYRDRTQYKQMADASINFIVLTQNDDGGWGTRPRAQDQPAATSDMTSFGWNVMALHIARRAGVSVPTRTLARAKAFLRAMEAADGPFGYRATPSATNRDELATVIGAMCQLLLEDVRDTARLRDYMRGLADTESDVQGGILFNLYATWLLSNGREDLFFAWNQRIQEELASRQALDAAVTGSWNHSPRDPIAQEMGRPYVTCVALLILQVPYRYPPITWDISP